VYLPYKGVRSRSTSPLPSAKLLDKPTAVAKLLRQVGIAVCSLLSAVEDVTVLEVADKHIVLGHRSSEIMPCCLYWEESAGCLSNEYFLTSIDASG